jgi:transcription-repair coupling factor (superfamily II helicase)
MSIESLTIQNSPIRFHNLIAAFNNQSEPVTITGCAGSADAFVISELFLKRAVTVLVLTADQKIADRLGRECSWLAGEDSVAVFPSRDAIPYNMRSPFGPTTEKRFSVLSQLLNHRKLIVITPAVSLLQKIPSPKNLFNRIIRIRTGDEIPIETLSCWLVENGFNRQTMVEDLGTFAIRGGIVDIYPFLTENPIRLEFFGNTIETIKEFNVFKQTSIKQCSSVDIFPMKEFHFTDSKIDEALFRIEEHCVKQNLDFNHFYKLKQQWKSHADHDGIEWFLHWFNPEYAHIAEYVPADSVVVRDDVLTLEHRLEENIRNYESHRIRVAEIQVEFVSKPEQLLIPVSTINEDLATLQSVSIHAQPAPQETSINLGLKQQPVFQNNIKLLTDDLASRDAAGYLTVIVCENKGHAERLQELLSAEPVTISIVLGMLENGFIDPVCKVALYTENQIFIHPAHRPPIKKSGAGHGVAISGYDSVQPGDFVVHIDHGISKFIGIERIQTSGANQDCMVLEFQERAKVYVPVEDFNKVQKYIGKDSGSPTLSKLGTNRWELQKTKTREALKEMAEHLIQLYAKREYLEGISFPPDTIWQKEFEDSFIYEETPDQDSAINDVKKDMESAKPMDRLVCGDVGFGKTEVAMRAAFKAATSGYQVAILAPTTILAAQHAATFAGRMGNFPITIATLSRFQKSKEQKKIVEGLKNGKIDIVIGTHRILSNDISFKNLGLLVIDEEQRFGVNHKEKLKQYRFKVDVLSMTATPIPRTLHMSLVGIRNLSCINTPPQNRLPIETVVMEYHEEILKTAIEAELDRGGQVYIVHNRIQNLTLLQMTIESLVPKARTVIAHGQMDEGLLEQIMKEFVAGKHDVLIATTIIENGLDIPNVNTIIVNRADALGLSQLYQLRGRVGRSSEQAYAYLLTLPFNQINEKALKRIKALEQYTELGSGFQIAMRDLEIRGAGNILGTHQHGYIAAVGFELYCQLLREEVNTLLGTLPEQSAREVKIDIPADAFFPPEYIPDSATRISHYQECSRCGNFEQIEQLQKQFVDRYGPLPVTVETLFTIMRIKVFGQKIGLSHIALTQENMLLFSFHGTDKEVREKLQKLLSDNLLQVEITYSVPIVIKSRLVSVKKSDKLLEIHRIMKDIFDKTGETST